MENLKISIIVVCYNEERNIGECIESIFLLEYPKENYEVIVVDGNSKDQTRDIVNNLMGKHKNLRLFINEKRTIASNRNVGIMHAQYEYIAFTDADCVVEKDWIGKLAAHYIEYKGQFPMIAAVGGGNVPFDNSSLFAAGIGAAMDSYLSCMGSVQGKEYSESRFVDSLACLNVLYEKEKILEAGGFDEALGNITEDYDLNFRLRQKGYRLLFIPQVDVKHKVRLGTKALMKQMYLYGKGRGRLIRYKPQTIRTQYLLPIVFLITNLIALVTFLDFVFLLPVLGYLATVALYSLYKGVTLKKLSLIPMCILVFLIIHYSYSVGEVLGYTTECRNRIESEN